MQPILAGLETEYGFSVEGRGAEDQMEDAITLVRAFPGECFVGWDYRFESPRTDLRGFQVDRLAFDPQDALFDAGKTRPTDKDIRSDRVLLNGARFYNDHGHPEYSTPECWSLRELALHDRAGESIVLSAAQAMERTTGTTVRVYKNNTDFHGAAYGTHESYAVPRKLGFDQLYQAVIPMLVARQVLTGAGKVGYEHGKPCDYQMTQRGDFFSEAANVETLYRRPVFNTRDEPHADPSDWIRLHVISGDANMLLSCTQRKVGLIKLALHLAMTDNAPQWRLAHPAACFQAVGRDLAGEGRIELEGGSWTTPRFILESYCDAAERMSEVDPEIAELIKECRQLLQSRHADPDEFRRHVDWAAKRWLISEYLAAEGLDWHSPMAQSLDLSYHRIDPEEGLFPALVHANQVEDQVRSDELTLRSSYVCEPTRAFARSIALRKFPEAVAGVSWGVLTLNLKDETRHVALPPDRIYPEELDNVETVDEFAALLLSETS